MKFFKLLFFMTIILFSSSLLAQNYTDFFEQSETEGAD